MTPVQPTVHAGEMLVTFAEDQPEYLPLPAMVDGSGVVTTEWEPSAEELHALLSGGRVRLRMHTFGYPLQPVELGVVEPECGVRES